MTDAQARRERAREIVFEYVREWDDNTIEIEWLIDRIDSALAEAERAGMERAAREICLCCRSAGFTKAEYIDERFYHRKGAENAPVWECTATAIHLAIRAQAGEGE